MVALRPYQQEAVSAVREEWAAGRRSTLLVQATGTGKTVVFAEIARRCAEKGNKTLVIAHRGELIDQAASKLSDAMGLEVGIEKANSHWYDGECDPMAVVASVQTLQGSRFVMFPLEEFSTLIIDEAHHAVADTYRRIIDRHRENGGYTLGVTATADRSDRRGLSEVFDSIAYEYPLQKAVAEGYLSPIKAKCLPLTIDLRGIKLSHGDYQAGELGSKLDPYLPEIAWTMKDECAGRKTVCFLPLVSTSEKMAEELNRTGLRAVAASGYDSATERARKKDAFERGEYDVLCNSMLYTEGWDCPAVDCIVALRPTKSRGLYCQMVGRGTRLAPGKDHLLLLDFLWMTDKHDLCRPASLLGKDAEITEKMTEMLEDGTERDMGKLAEDAEKDAAAEREAKLAEELERQRKKKKKLVDPLQYAMSIDAESLADYVPTKLWEFGAVTDRQKALLERNGIDWAGAENAGQASVLIDAIVKRNESGMSTPKQIRLLERFGFAKVGTWTREQASAVISRYAAASWKPWLVNIDPKTYDPRKTA